jgi:tetratricopeptide (TPR) repeat protein
MCVFSGAAAGAAPGSGAVPLDDAALTRMARSLVHYSDRPPGAPPVVRVVDEPGVLCYRRGASEVRVSRAALAAVGDRPGRVAFLLGGPLVLLADARDPLPPEAAVAADRTALLWMLRAGLPLTEGLETLDSLAPAGTLWPDNAGGAPLSDRKVAAAHAVADMAHAVLEFDDGVLDIAQRRWPQGRARFAAYVELLPDSYAGLNNLGLCLAHLATDGLARHDLLRADTVVATPDREVFRGASIGLDTDRYHEAEQALNLALTLCPDGVEALNNRGNLRAAAQDWAGSQADFEHALKVDPLCARAANNLGVTLVEAHDGHADAASVAQFRRAAHNDPTLAEAWWNLGRAMHELNLEGFAHPFQRYVALAPDGVHAFEAKRLSRGAGRLQDMPSAPMPVGVAGWLDFKEKVRLALAENEADVVKVLSDPDCVRDDPSGTRLLGWSRRGLFVELSGGKVRRVVGGRAADAEPLTPQGIAAGAGANAVRERYGDPPRVTHQAPYDMWLYPAAGLAFYFVERRVEKIALYPVVGSTLGEMGG